MLHGHPPTDTHLSNLCVYIQQIDSFQTFKKQLRTIRFGPQRLRAVNESKTDGW